MNAPSLPKPSGAPAGKSVLTALRSGQRAGLIGLVLFAGSFVAWSRSTNLQGAVASGGQFVAATEVKRVQHPVGGVVGQLFVREGDKVAAGMVVLRLDDTLMRANYQIVAKQLDEFAVRRARLDAERDGTATIEFEPEIAARASEPEVRKLMDSEIRLFEIRRAARDGQKLQLAKRIEQLREEIRGLGAQKAAKEQESKIIAVELVGVTDLFAKNLVQISRLSALQREAASLSGQIGQLVASTAQAEGKISETEQQVAQLDSDLRAEAMKELRDIQAKTGELVERRTAAEDQLRRVDVRAPTSGTVHQLAVHTVGGVIGPGETAMLVVPRDDELQLEARVSPVDIDQVWQGQLARVKIQAGNRSTNPELNGTVTRVSADVTRDDKQSPPYYSVRIVLPASELARIADFRIMPGMQAEVFIETQARTPFEYFMKPVSDQFARMFRER